MSKDKLVSLDQMWATTHANDPAREQSIRLRVRLMSAIEKYITDKKITQEKAAQLFSTSQPRISALLKGKTEKFSIDSLLDMMAIAGMKVSFTINVKPTRITKYVNA